jgi:hypothetical protein
VRRAADWLEGRQNPDGGFALQSGPSNAQSTAWAVQGLIAAGRNPARVRRGGSRSPLGYLRSLVTASGAIRYSRTSAQTPVWVTAQALTALAGKRFPLRPAPRERRPKAAAATPAPEPTPAQPKPQPTATDDAGPATPESEPAANRAITVALAAPAAPAITVATVLVPANAAPAGYLAAVLARTWLPAGR